jgi:hypothetical protein
MEVKEDPSGFGLNPFGLIVIAVYQVACPRLKKRWPCCDYDLIFNFGTEELKAQYMYITLYRPIFDTMLSDAGAQPIAISYHPAGQ